MALVGGSLTPQASPEIAITPVAAVAEVAAPAHPNFNFLGKTVTVKLAEAGAATTTTTLPVADRPHFAAPPASVPSPESWISPESASSFEQSVEAAFDPQELGKAGLTLVGIRPPETGQRRPRTQSTSQQPAINFVYAFVTLDGLCATAFIAEEGKLDESGRFIIHPAFSGLLPEIADPDYYNSRAMYDSRISQSEVAEHDTTTPDNGAGVAEIDSPLCESFETNHQPGTDQLVGSQQP